MILSLYLNILVGHMILFESKPSLCHLGNLQADVSQKLSGDLGQSVELLVGGVFLTAAVTSGLIVVLKDPQNGSSKRKTWRPKKTVFTLASL